MLEPCCNDLFAGQHPILPFNQLLHSLLVRIIVPNCPQAWEVDLFFLCQSQLVFLLLNVFLDLFQRFQFEVYFVRIKYIRSTFPSPLPLHKDCLRSFRLNSLRARFLYRWRQDLLAERCNDLAFIGGGRHLLGILTTISPSGYFEQLLQVALHWPALKIPECIFVLQRVVHHPGRSSRRRLETSLPLSFSHVFLLLRNQDAFQDGVLKGIGQHAIKL